jgi:hyperosmotically inducible periplasmic protein
VPVPDCTAAAAGIGRDPITTRVHERFVGQDLLNDSDISVDTNKHIVTLKGTVRGQAGRARATTVAKNTEGVRAVVNRLTVGPKR